MCLNFGVYIRFFAALFGSTVTAGQFEGNTYMKGEVISIISKIGPTMCVNKCKSSNGCSGINFDRQQLTCELLRINTTSDDRSVKPGSMYTALSSWQTNNTTCLPNPCSQNMRCAVSNQNKAICIPFVFFMETITSTDYPGQYPNNEEKTWRFAVESNFKLVLKFTAFNLETNFDFLKIYEREGGAELYSLTGQHPPDDIWSKDNGLFIKFTSDDSVTWLGFSMDIYKTS
ncbi:CUB and sushi domain-containing protein 1-like [Mytilus trossulus]|uniref:CUB and sushi domain-containing protein 1-like n=1 Tax=Mytilus trossulus TaxID=6551 RepID=UPI0030067E0F